MSCKRHPSSQGPGVCASCLRDRLLSLLTDGSPSSSHPTPPMLSPAADAGRGGRTRGRFSISRLFGHRRSRSEDRKSGSWIHGLFRGHRRARRARAAAAAAEAENDILPGRASAPYPARARGMSPAATGDDESDSGTESGYSTSTTSSAPIRRGAPRQHRRRRGHRFLDVWISPLEPPRPQWERRQAAEGVAEEFSGDLRRGVAGGGAAPRWANRSRKLADVGRFR